MSKKTIHLKIPGPESVVVSKEERYEIIAEVARALEERRNSNRMDYESEWEGSDPVYDFTAISQQFN
jgi:hypothetical protein